MTAAAPLKLYELADALDRIGDALIENGGELTPEIEAQLNELDHSFTKKLETVILYMRNVEAAAVAAENEAQRLFDLGKRRRSAAARLKEYAKRCMELANVPRVETDRIIVRIQKNSRPSISCTVPLEQLPEGYVRVTKTFNAEVAYELHKAGMTLPAGIDVVIGTHLRIS